MSFTLAAERYARALYEVAAAAGELDAVLMDMDTAGDILQRLPEVRAYCLNRTVTPGDALRTVEIAFVPYVGGTVARTLRLLAANGRLASLPFLPGAFTRLHNRREGIVDATVEFAHPPAEGVAERIRERLRTRTGGRVRLAVKINPAILGGYVITWPGMMLDNSALRRTRQLGRALESGRA